MDAEIVGNARTTDEHVAEPAAPVRHRQFGDDAAEFEEFDAQRASVHAEPLERWLAGVRHEGLDRHTPSFAIAHWRPHAAV